MKHILIGTALLAASSGMAFAAPTYGEMPAEQSYLSNTISAIAPLATAEDIPYIHEFNNSKSLDGFTIWASGTAARTWQYKEVKGAADPSQHWWGACCPDKYTGSKNEWLVTPALNLVEGKEYNVKIRVTAGTNMSEKLEVLAGTECQQDAMVIPVIPTTGIWGKGYPLANATTLEGSFIADKTGDNYVALHCTSEAASSATLCVYDITITEKAMGDAPAAPSDFQATADPDGALKVSVSCKAPSKTAGGQTLSSLTAVEILRDNKTIKTFENPKPGASISFDDTEVTSGAHTYGVVAVNGQGRSDVVDRTVYVGVYTPEKVTDVVATETETVGTVKITWTAPTQDTHGKPLKPERLTYRVISYLDGQKAGEYTANTNEYTVKICEPDAKQSFRSFGVVAITNGGEADEVMADAIAVGKADVLPYHESFANGKTTFPILTRSVQYGATWTLMNTQDQAQDGDNGYMKFASTGIGGEADVQTGKIDLTGQDHPVLNFWYSGMGNYNTNTITVLINDGNGFEPVGDEFVAETASWAPASLDLSAYAGKTIQIIFRGTCNYQINIALDNISIGSAFAKDLTIVRPDVPTNMTVLEEEPMTFTVANIGTETSAPYKVKLYCMDKEIDSQDGPALEAGGEYDFEFRVIPPMDSYDKQTYYAKVEWDDDQNQANNVTARFIVYIDRPELQNVSGVKIELVEDNKRVLTWDTPEGASFDSTNPYHHLLGYNIYINGTLANTEPLKENTYTDSAVYTEEPRYKFETVYEAGKSEMSPEYILNGINDILADASAFGITTGAGFIAAADGTDATVYDMSGRTVGRINGSTLSCAAGIYLVRTAGKTFKVTVR